jgi:hypothetical protein
MHFNRKKFFGLILVHSCSQRGFEQDMEIWTLIRLNLQELYEKQAEEFTHDYEKLTTAQILDLKAQ